MQNVLGQEKVSFERLLLVWSTELCVWGQVVVFTGFGLKLVEADDYNCQLSTP